MLHQIKLDRFTGLFPRKPELNLPPNAATIAENCDFAYGELRSIKENYLLKTLSESIASVFSEDGLRFYTWPSDTDAEITPIGAGADSDRLYFTGSTGFRVTSRSGASSSGGQPGTSYFVGVPKPTVAPIVTIDAGVASVELEAITPIATFHYEYKGMKYQEVIITASTITNGKKYAFTAPTRRVSALSGAPRAAMLQEVGYDPYTELLDDPTPKDAIAVIRLQFITPVVGPTQDGKALGETKLDQYSTNSSLANTSGLRIELTQDDDNKQLYTATLGDQAAQEDLITAAYVFTCVNIYNEEGPPSPPTVATFSPSVKRTIGATIPPFGQYVPIKEIRVYRTQNGGTSDEYFFSFSIPAIGQSGVVNSLDSVPAAMLNEPIKSHNYYPPNQNLKGLRNVGNGILAAWFGNELWFSDAYKPWSWPPSYMKNFGWPIVGAEVQGTGLLVTTLGNPYAVFGITPDSMTSDKLNIDQAGVSKWAIASVSGRMIYASNDGLVTVNGGHGSLNESQFFFTREVWRDKYQNHLGTMQFAKYDGALLVFSRNGGFTPFLIRLDEAEGAMSELPGLIAHSVFYLVTTDGLYVTNGNALYQFGGGVAKAFKWQSKLFRPAAPTSYSSVEAITDGSFSVEFYADGVLKHTETITQSQKFKTFKLPSGFLPDTWQFKITGTGRFKLLHVAQSGRQLGEG